jgi:hypothetical protein
LFPQEGQIFWSLSSNIVWQVCCLGPAGARQFCAEHAFDF